MESLNNIDSIENLVNMHIEKINKDRRKIIEGRIIEELLMLKEVIILYGAPGPGIIKAKKKG